jgi:hypothetical protein
MHCLVNADIFLLISGQRGYFFEQRLYFQNEINRLQELYQKYAFKKKKWKDEYTMLRHNSDRTINRLELEINKQLKLLTKDKKTILTQTEVDCYEYNKMQRDYDNVNKYKNLVQNKLQSYIQLVEYKITKEKPINLKDLLSLIPDMYNEKIEHDNLLHQKGKSIPGFDYFFYDYMKNKYQLDEVINTNV